MAATRTPATEEQYARRGRRLLERFWREEGGGSPAAFAAWLVGLKPSLTQSSWRVYRQAGRAALAAVPGGAVGLAVLDAETAGHEPRRRRDQPRRTSGLKRKRIPKEDLDRLEAWLRRFSRSRHAAAAADWLVATVATGLRPAEWQEADLVETPSLVHPGGMRVALRVANAKATNGRANGEARTIDVSSFRPSTLAAVARMAAAGRLWGEDGAFGQMQAACSGVVYHACQAIWGGAKRYCLYSARHQFLANAKRYCSPAQVSALAGHTVTDTAFSSYGRRAQGWHPDAIADRALPLPEETARVTVRPVTYEERMAARALRRQPPLAA